MILGPAAGTALLGLGSTATALRLDGASFLLAAITIVPLPARSPATTSRQEKADGDGGGVSGGPAGRLGRRHHRPCQSHQPGHHRRRGLALPRAAADHYGHLAGYGATVVAIASGAILAAILAGRLRPPREPGRATYTAVLAWGAATLGFGLARGLVVAVLLGVVFGAGQQLAELWWTTSLQRNIADQLRGRIIAVDHFGSFVLLPLSFVVGGLVVEAVGPEGGPGWGRRHRHARRERRPGHAHRAPLAARHRRPRGRRSRPARSACASLQGGQTG